jgi:hypothetical protein
MDKLQITLSNQYPVWFNFILRGKKPALPCCNINNYLVKIAYDSKFREEENLKRFNAGKELYEYKKVQPVIDSLNERNLKNKIGVFFLDIDTLPPTFPNFKNLNNFLDHLLPSDKFIVGASPSGKTKIIFTYSSSYNIGSEISKAGNKEIFRDNIINLINTYIPEYIAQYVDTSESGFYKGFITEDLYNKLKTRIQKLTPVNNNTPHTSLILSYGKVLDHTSVCVYPLPDPDTACPDISHFVIPEVFEDSLLENSPYTLEEIEVLGKRVKQRDFRSALSKPSRFTNSKFNYYTEDILPFDIKLRSNQVLHDKVLRILLSTPKLIVGFDLSKEKLAQQVELIFGIEVTGTEEYDPYLECNRIRKDRPIRTVIDYFIKKGLLECIDHTYNTNKAKTFRASGKLREYLLSKFKFKVKNIPSEVPKGKSFSINKILYSLCKSKRNPEAYRQISEQQLLYTSKYVPDQYNNRKKLYHKSYNNLLKLCNISIQ